MTDLGLKSSSDGLQRFNLLEIINTSPSGLSNDLTQSKQLGSVLWTRSESQGPHRHFGEFRWDCYSLVFISGCPSLLVEALPIV